MDFVPFAFMAVRFAFVSADTNAIPADTNAIPADTNAIPADTNAIPADTNAIQRILGYPHQWNRCMAFIIVIASSGRISFPLHAWPPGSRLCQLTQTRYQLTQTRYGEFRLSTPMKSVAFMIVIDFTSGRISFPLHSWPLGSRLCQLTQTRYQLTQTRYGAC